MHAKLLGDFTSTGSRRVSASMLPNGMLLPRRNWSTGSSTYYIEDTGVDDGEEEAEGEEDSEGAVPTEAPVHKAGELLPGMLLPTRDKSSGTIPELGMLLPRRDWSSGSATYFIDRGDEEEEEDDGEEAEAGAESGASGNATKVDGSMPPPRVPSGAPEGAAKASAVDKPEEEAPAATTKRDRSNNTAATDDPASKAAKV